MKSKSLINTTLTLLFVPFFFLMSLKTVYAEEIVFGSPLINVTTTNSSGFGEDRGGGVTHKGVDLTGDTTTPIYAVADGKVTQAGFGGVGCSADQCGNWVSIAHEGTVGGKTPITSSYLHLSSYTVNVGDEVKRGQQVGFMGTTGNSTGVHLHMELNNGTFYQNEIDPTALLGLPAVGESKQMTGEIVEGTATTDKEEETVSTGDNDAWKNPLVVFKESKVVSKVTGLIKGDEFSAEGIYLADMISAKFYDFCNIVIVSLVIFVFAFMLIATVFYLTILPRGGSTKLNDTFEKVTGQAAVVNNQGNLQIFGSMFIATGMLIFVLTGSHLFLLGKFYYIISYILSYII